MRVASNLVLTLALGVASLAPAAVVRAQEASDSETALARRLFREGIEASRAGNFARARDAFESSYQLSERPTTLINLAGALAQTGSLVEAAEKYRRYLRVTRDEGDPRRREAARQMLQELLLRMPYMMIQVEGLAESDVLRLDEEVLSHAVVGERLPVDPDHHSVTLHRGDEIIATEEFAVEEAQQQDVVFDVSDVPRLPTVPTPTEVAQNGGGGTGGSGSGSGALGAGGGEGETGGGGLFASPIFWIVVGAVLIGGGVTAYLFLTREQTAPPFAGNVVPGRLVLD